MQRTILYRMMYYFSFTRFLSQRVFPSKVLTRHILLSMDTQGRVLWINGRPLIYTITHMIDNHIIHYSLCNILYLLFDFISFLGYHIVSINRTRPINNKTHIQTDELLPILSFSIFYCFFSIIYYSLCYSLYFITRYQHDAPTNWGLMEAFPL